MTLIFGTVGALRIGADFFTVLGFFFDDAFRDVACFGAAFLEEAAFAPLLDDALGVGFADLVGVATTGLGAAATGVGFGGAVAGAMGAVAVAGAGVGVGATLDVVVLLACCVPFVAPKRPVMKGFAMQS